MQLESYNATSAELWREPERRRRLVRLCATITGDRSAAEDLAQETLLEAWRNVHKLHDPSGADRWLAAIARNVCHRWARRRGRDSAVVAPLDVETAPAADVDLEMELERAELVDLLDRALALLPAETREVLVQRYVHESPHAEIGERLGVSEDAVSMRLTRGKVVLRRLLASELRDDASAHDLISSSDAGWRETRVWCSECGRRKLLMRSEPSPGSLAFRCPGCHAAAGAISSEYRRTNPLFARLIGDLISPAPIIKRVAEWSSRYFDATLDEVECTRCGRPAPLRPHIRDDVSARSANRRGLVVACEACGEQTWSSIAAVALARPEVREFRREHPRLRALPERGVEAGGVPAVVLRYENVVGTAGIDVIFARDTLRVLAVHGPTG